MLLGESAADTAAAEAGDKAKEDQRSRPWTTEEDTLVRSLVEAHGTKRWSLIASNLTGRTGKQCRERWHNQLDPAIKNHWNSALRRELRKLNRQNSAIIPALADGVDAAGRVEHVAAKLRQQQKGARARTKLPGVTLPPGVEGDLNTIMGLMTD